MKRFIVLLLGILLIGCLCAADQEDSKKGFLVKKTSIEFHHSENCDGHNFLIGRIDFQQEGHDMWMFIKEGNDGKSYNISDVIDIIHSPNCRLCNPDAESTIEETTTTTSDYWGW